MIRLHYGNKSPAGAWIWVDTAMATREDPARWDEHEELIGGWIRTYIDVDRTGDWPVTALSTMQSECIEAIQRVTGETDLAVAVAHRVVDSRLTKFSMHVVGRVEHSTPRDVRAYLERHACTAGISLESLGVDLAVYSAGASRKFRCVWSRTANGERPMRPITHLNDLSRHLVQSQRLSPPEVRRSGVTWEAIRAVVPRGRRRITAEDSAKTAIACNEILRAAIDLRVDVDSYTTWLYCVFQAGACGADIDLVSEWTGLVRPQHAANVSRIYETARPTGPAGITRWLADAITTRRQEAGRLKPSG